MSEKSKGPGHIYYGGQAVLEGVMIRGPKSVAVACRRPNGDIAVRTEPLGVLYTGPLRHIPFIRGVIVLWETLALGMRALIWSSNVQLGEDDKEATSGAMWVTAIISLVVVTALFFTGPLLLADFLDSVLHDHLLVVLVEGVIRLAVIVGYMGVIGLLPDVRRVYEYHGAEHMTIHAMENRQDLTAENVRQHPTAHVRCGTSFLLTVVLVSIIVFALVGNPDLWLRVVSRIVLIPVIASISYELIRLGGAFESSPITRTLMAPNLALQALTTKPPDDSQIEIAIRALNEVLAAERSLERVAPELATEAEEAIEAAPPLD